MRLSTVVLRRSGSRSPSLAMSSVIRATIATAGSLRSRSPSESKTLSNATVMAAISSGANTPFSDSKSGRIGTVQARNPIPAAYIKNGIEKRKKLGGDLGQWGDKKSSRVRHVAGTGTLRPSACPGKSLPWT